MSTSKFDRVEVNARAADRQTAVFLGLVDQDLLPGQNGADDSAEGPRCIAGLSQERGITRQREHLPTPVFVIGMAFGAGFPIPLVTGSFHHSLKCLLPGHSVTLNVGVEQ